MRLQAALCALGLLACSKGAVDPLRGPECESRLARPQGDVHVARMELGRPPQDVGVTCKEANCLHVEPDLVAVRHTDGRIWGAWDGHAGDWLAPKAPDQVSPQDLRARSLPLSRQVGAAGGPSPVLPPELRTCGQSVAGGGVGWHVIRNADNVWQRVEWVQPPTDAAVLGLAPGAYPLASGDGTLCGYATQASPRNWNIHVMKPGVPPLAARKDQEHPPARCVEGGAVRVQADDGEVLLKPDGTHERLTTTVPPAPTPAGVIARDFVGSRLFKAETQTLVVAASAGTWELSLPAGGTDVGGARVAPEAWRLKTTVVGSGGPSLLVLERFKLPDCSVRDVMNVVDTDARKVWPVPGTPGMVLRVGHGLGAFWWAHAQPGVMDLNEPQPAATVEF